MKGHMEDGKFHPHKSYQKGVRKSRDQKTKTQGVRKKIGKEKCPACGKMKYLTGYGKCQSCYAEGRMRKKLDDSQKKILRNWVKRNPNWTTIDDLPNEIFIPLVAPANDDIDKRVAIQKEAIDFMKSVTPNSRKARDNPEPIIETELNDIFDEVADPETGEINFRKLEDSAINNIKYILKREKKLRSDQSISVYLVDSREETSRKEFEKTGQGFSGFYQYDYTIWNGNDRTKFSGTAYGSISHGEVLDMQLELYNEDEL